MDVEKEPQHYGYTKILESFSEQQDDEMLLSPMSSSYRETSLIEKERCIREEIQQFEALEKELESHERSQRILPITHTTVIETEAYFRMNEHGSQMTKRFYHNEFSSENKEKNRSYKIIPIETTNEQDYIEEEYTIDYQEGDFPYQTNEETYAEVIDQSDQFSFPSPGKSILKKPFKEPTISIRSLSPSYSNEILNSVELTDNPTRSQSQEELTARYSFSNQSKPSSYRKQYISWSPARDEMPKPSLDNSKTKESFSTSSPNLNGSSRVSPASMIEEKKIFFPSPLPQIVDVPPQNDREHSETIQSYDHVLDKMRETDEQLQSLSRSWTNTVQQQRTSIKGNAPIKNKEFISPMFLQACLLMLIIFNLLIVYFFNDIHIFWSRFFSYSTVSNHQDDEKFSYW